MSDTTDQLPTSINGPINLVRLEGTINNIPKIIYLYMDIHESLKSQTKCPEEDAIDISQFLERVFENPKPGINYDFFMENVFPYLHTDINPNLVGNIYIHQTVKMFAKYFKMTREEKVLVVKTIPHIRFHYADPRYYMLSDIRIMLNWSKGFPETPDDLDKLTELISLIQQTKTEVTNWKQLFNQLNPECQKSSDYKTYLEYFINKIFCRIKNETIKEKFHTYGIPQITRINNELLDMLTKYLEKCQEYKRQVKQKITNPYQKHTTKQLDYGKLQHEFKQCHKYLLNVVGNFMDFFFLRRVLDKDYIDHAILYAGANHSINCVGFLVKYFGFQITHCAYSSIFDVQKLNKQIKNEKCIGHLTDIFYPDKPIQCIQTDHFPEPFE